MRNTASILLGLVILGPGCIFIPARDRCDRAIAREDDDRFELCEDYIDFEDTGEDWPTDDWQATTGVENPYQTYVGRELFDFSEGAEVAGMVNCHIEWDLVGEAVDPISTNCDDCVFMFEMRYTLDETATTDDGTCESFGLVTDKTGYYGYSASFESYGQAWVMSYYGWYYWWGYAEFIDDQFSYQYGYIDYPYGVGYYTYYQYGIGIVD